MLPPSPPQHPSANDQLQAFPWAALAPVLRCPICGESLRLEGHALVCATRHSFDLARAGYVNLLPSQRGAAHRPGDAPEMLRARDRFLQGGAYAPLAEAVAAAVAAFRAPRVDGARQPDVSPLVVDVGCGTGYYLRVVGERLRADGIARPDAPVRLLGIDVATDAARTTARRLAGMEGIDGAALVADLRRGLPLRDGVADVLLDIFAPRDAKEFARVLAPGGLLVLLLPRAEHLRELRALVPLLNVEEDKEEHALARLASRFDLLGRQAIDETISLTGPALHDLVAMTPSARHLDPADLMGLEAHGPLDVTLACTLLTLRRRDTSPGLDATHGGTMREGTQSPPS